MYMIAGDSEEISTAQNVVYGITGNSAHCYRDHVLYSYLCIHLLGARATVDGDIPPPPNPEHSQHVQDKNNFTFTTKQTVTDLTAIASQAL